jgi:Fe-S-cluster containining protein
MEKMLEMGMAAVYGDEDPAQPDAAMNCRACLSECQARCCTYIFALTKAEVEQGIVQYNRQKPYFIARDEDGYCPHLNRQSLQCEVWEARPLRCRRYDCKEDHDIWPQGFPSQDD